jgi:hypothetical protein
VQRRVSLYELKELLGHSSLTMVKRYAHLAPEHLRAAAAALDGVLASEPARPSKETATRAPEALRSDEDAVQLLDSVVSRPGLEPGTP